MCFTCALGVRVEWRLPRVLDGCPAEGARFVQGGLVAESTVGVVVTRSPNNDYIVLSVPFLAKPRLQVAAIFCMRDSFHGSIIPIEPFPTTQTLPVAMLPSSSLSTPTIPIRRVWPRLRTSITSTSCWQSHFSKDLRGVKQRRQGYISRISRLLVSSSDSSVLSRGS